MRLGALVFNPLLDHRFVLHDLHPRFERLEGHAGEPLGVKLMQLALVIMQVGRSEDDPAQAALRHKSIGPLGRFSGGFLRLVEHLEIVPQQMRHRFVFGEPKRFVERADKKRLRHLARRVLDHVNFDHLAFRLLQEQLRDVE